MEPQSPLAIANYFLELASREGKPVTQMQLQKLVYFAHGWCLGLTGQPLINESVEAWKFGPVIRSLYDSFRAFGRSPVTEPGVRIEFTSDGLYRPYAPSLGNHREELSPLLDKVWSTYKDLSAFQLSSITHEPNSPWSHAWNEANGQLGWDIKNDAIKDYFMQKVSARPLLNA